MDNSKLLLTSLALLAILPTTRAGTALTDQGWTAAEEAATKTVPPVVHRCGFSCVVTTYPYAILSRGAYRASDLFSWNGWQRAAPIDEDFWSGYRASVYRHDERKEFVIAYSGTDSPSDLLSDIGQMIGLLPAQYLYAGDTALAVVTTRLNVPEFADYKITYTGHSLGGGLAQFAARTFQGRAVTFNSVAISSGVALEAASILADHRIYAPERLGEEERIHHIVTRNEYGEFDWVPELDGALWGTTHALRIDEFGEFLLDVIDSHSIHTVIGALETELANPPFGGLTLTTDWSCQGSEEEISLWYVFRDGRIDAVRTGGLGLWGRDGEGITIVDPDGTTYTGTLNPESLSMTGSMQAVDGSSGCWKAGFAPL